MEVEEETEIRSDLRRFAGSLKKGFVSDRGFARIIYFIIGWEKGNCPQAQAFSRRKMIINKFTRKQRPLHG
jgi:hypothetical protein